MTARRLLSAVTSLVIAWAVATPAHATTWTVVPAESRIAFAATHAGKGLTGQFKTWQATITFDPENLAAAAVKVTVDLASAATGDVTYDRTLPTADWLDVAKQATATYETQRITALGGGRYQADGTLEIRGVKVATPLAFDLKIDGDTVRMTGTASVARLAFGIGKGSDTTGTWVALDIPITVTVVAQRR